MKRLALLLIFVVCQAAALMAQNINFKHLQPEDGLSQVSVNSICVDSLGTLWIATRQGLNHYDGNEVTVFQKKKGDPHSLFCNTVLKVVTDGKHTLYLQCTEGLAKMNIATRQFETISKAPVGAIAYHGKLYVGIGNVVYAYNDKIEPHEVARLPRGVEISSIGFDDKGRMLIGTTSKGLFLSTGHGTLRHLIARGKITDIYTDRDHDTWIGSWNDGMYRITPNGKIINIKVKDSHGLKSNFVRAFCQDDLGALWIGTFGGLQRYDKHTGTYVSYTNTEREGSLSNNSVWCITKDPQGTLWIGTYFGGVNYFNPEYEIYTYFYKGQTPAEGLSSPIVGCMTEDDKGHLWICTEGGGLNMYDRKTGRLEWYQIPTTPGSINHNNLKAIYFDKKRDCLWIGTHLGGLYRLDLKTKHFTVYRHKEGDSHSLPSNIIRDIIPRGDQLILATQNGVCVFTPETGHASPLFGRTKTGKHLSVIPAVALDHNDKLWIGTERDGVFCYNFKTSRLLWYKHNDNNPRSLSGNNINKIYVDKANNVWICTSGTGLDRYIPQTNTFVNYDTKRNHLASDCVYAVSESSLSPNKLLVITNMGFSELDIPKGRFRNYGRSNGFPLSIVNEGALHVSRDGYVFLGGIKGMIAFKEKMLSNIVKRYHLAFSRLFVNGKEIYPHDETRVLNEALPYTGKIALKSNVKRFAIEVANSNHMEDNRARLLYRLKGYSTAWSELRDGQKQVSFTNLSPGTYTLECKSMQADIPEIQLQIDILPEWYKTWWAYGIYVIVTVLIIWYLAHNYNERIRLAESLKYERQHAKDIEEMNQSKLRFFTNISHEIRNPLTVIIGLSESLLGMEAINPKIYSKLLSIHRSCTQLREFISELLDFRKQEQGKVKLQLSEIDFAGFVYEIYLIYKEYAASKKIVVDFSCDSDRLMVCVDAAEMRKVVNNLLANAIKHTPQDGVVHVTISHDNKRFVLDVTNTGSVISQEEIAKIFDRYYQVGQLETSSNELGTGIGLALVKGIVELHHGSIRVLSNQEQGTSFIINLPIGQLTGQPSNESPKINAIPRLPIMEQPQEDDAPDEEAKGATILIIEDNVALLNMLSELFSPYYKVITAQDGEQGLAAVKANMPDIVLTDLVMPKMLGTELCKAIKYDPSICHIPVVLLTARTSIDNQVESLKIGADDYITKPFVTSILLSRCNNLVNTRRMLQQRFSRAEDQEPDMLATTEIDKKLLERAMELIKDNYQDPNFNVDTFARELGMSRTALFNKWKSLTSDTPMSFIQTYRLKKAAHLLSSSESVSIAEVSERCGFASSRYFCKCFKDFYHTTPSKYKSKESGN